MDIHLIHKAAITKETRQQAIEGQVKDKLPGLGCASMR